MSLLKGEVEGAEVKNSFATDLDNHPSAGDLLKCNLAELDAEQLYQTGLELIAMLALSDVGDDFRRAMGRILLAVQDCLDRNHDRMVAQLHIVMSDARVDAGRLARLLTDQHEEAIIEESVVESPQDGTEIKGRVKAVMARIAEQEAMPPVSDEERLQQDLLAGKQGMGYWVDGGINIAPVAGFGKIPDLSGVDTKRGNPPKCNKPN